MEQNGYEPGVRNGKERVTLLPPSTSTASMLPPRELVTRTRTAKSGSTWLSSAFPGKSAAEICPESRLASGVPRSVMLTRAVLPDRSEAMVTVVWRGEASSARSRKEKIT